jgi:hypothetical protein
MLVKEILRAKRRAQDDLLGSCSGMELSILALNEKGV